MRLLVTHGDGGHRRLNLELRRILPIIAVTMVIRHDQPDIRLTCRGGNTAEKKKNA